MNFKSIFTLSAAVLFLGQPLLADNHAEGEPTMSPLKKSMKETSSALKLLRKIDKTDFAAGAAAANQAAAAYFEGMKYVAPDIEKMPEGKEKSVALADYRRLMGIAYAALCSLEIAYISEDQAQIDAAMSDVKAVKKEGHQKYDE